MIESVDRVAAKLLADVRLSSGVSQAELARRTGISQSVLSAYEHGRRQPSVAALARIARAAGRDLEIGPPPDELNLARAGKVLIDVIELADRMPSKDRGELAYPPLIGLAS